MDSKQTHLSVIAFSTEISNRRILIDVRTASEYAEGHIAGAVLLDITSPHFLEKLQSFDPERSYALYCHSGGRSAFAIHRMRELGFFDVVDLDGGLLAWEEAGNAVSV